jgi:hypothetical protein
MSDRATSRRSLMQPSTVQSTCRSSIIAACLIAALIAQTALADCPPGYRSKAGHCVPSQAQSHHPFVMKSNEHPPIAVSPMHAKPHTFAPKMIDKSKVKPQPGVPIEQHASASSTHGIIFVGGKQALNPQPIPPGKNTLNPQPIPPGHAVHKPPQPGAPVQQAISH